MLAWLKTFNRDMPIRKDCSPSVLLIGNYQIKKHRQSLAKKDYPSKYKSFTVG